MPRWTGAAHGGRGGAGGCCIARACIAAAGAALYSGLTHPPPLPPHGMQGSWVGTHSAKANAMVSAPLVPACATRFALALPAAAGQQGAEFRLPLKLELNARPGRLCRPVGAGHAGAAAARRPPAAIRPHTGGAGGACTLPTKNEWLLCGQGLPGLSGRLTGSPSSLVNRRK